MVKRIIVGIVIFITVGVVGGISCLNYKFDNSVEKENVLNVANLQDKIDNTLEQEVNEIKDDSNNLKENTVANINSDTVTKKENEQNKSEKVNTTKTNVAKNNIKENKKTEEKAIIAHNKETQEKNNNKKEEVPKKEETKEENKTKEPIYNQTETNRMIASIDKFAKQNPDLIGKNGEKLYKVRVSKDAMQFNCFYPFRESQIEAKVANVFSCTFVIYAVDVNGVTKYYIGIE